MTYCARICSVAPHVASQSARSHWYYRPTAQPNFELRKPTRVQAKRLKHRQDKHTHTQQLKPNNKTYLVGPNLGSNTITFCALSHLFLALKEQRAKPVTHKMNQPYKSSDKTEVKTQNTTIETRKEETAHMKSTVRVVRVYCAAIAPISTQQLRSSSPALTSSFCLIFARKSSLSSFNRDP